MDRSTYNPKIKIMLHSWNSKDLPANKFQYYLQQKCHVAESNHNLLYNDILQDQRASQSLLTDFVW